MDAHRIKSKFRKLESHIAKNLTKYILLTIALTLFAVGSVYAARIFYEHWFPPYLIIPNKDIADKVIIQTSKGTLTIKMEKRSRFAAAQFTNYIRSGFYDNTRIHRIVPDLLIEMGDPLTKDLSLRKFWGQGGSASVYRNDTHIDDNMDIGTVAFSGSNIGTYGSQFFIVTKKTPWLNKKHTIVGKVTEGFEILKTIEKSPIDAAGIPKDNIDIISISAP